MIDSYVHIPIAILDSDADGRDSFKLIITHLLNRRNTITGVRYGSDPTFLALESGNEMK